MLETVKSGLALLAEGITFIQAQPLLMVPIGLSIGGLVIAVVKRNLRR